MGGPIVNTPPLAHPAPDLVPKRRPEAGLEKEDPAVLPAPCPAVQSQTPIPLDLGLDHGLDHGLHLRKGVAPVTPRVVPAPRPVPPHGPLPLCPVPLPGGGSTLIPPLAPAPGVAPGHGLDPLQGELSVVETEDCTAPRIGRVMVEVQRQIWTR